MKKEETTKAAFETIEAPKKELNMKARRPKAKLMDSSGPLNCKPIEGYHLRWVSLNDPQQPRNWQWAEAQGYEVVTPEEQDIKTDSQYTKDIGSDIRVTGRDGVVQVLMKQPMEFYEESIEEITKYNDEQVSRKDIPGAPNAVGTFGKNVHVSTSNVKGV